MPRITRLIEIAERPTQLQISGVGFILKRFPLPESKIANLKDSDVTTVSMDSEDMINFKTTMSAIRLQLFETLQYLGAENLQALTHPNGDFVMQWRLVYHQSSWEDYVKKVLKILRVFVPFAWYCLKFSLIYLLFSKIYFELSSVHSYSLLLYTMIAFFLYLTRRF